MNANEMKTPTQTLGSPSGESGFTLIELLIGIMVTLGIIMAALPVIDGASKSEGRIQQAALSVGQARAFSEQVLRDVRSAKLIDMASTSSRIIIDTYVRDNPCGSGTVLPENDPATECIVTYSCSAAGTCTRQEGGAAPITMITGLANFDPAVEPVAVPVFTYFQPGDKNRFVWVHIVLPNQQNVGGDAITLEDGAAPRNLT